MFLFEKRGATLYVRVTGELDHSLAERLRPELDERLADSRVRRLVFDFTQLVFMDSSGIGLIIGRYKLMNRKGGSVAISGTGSRVDRLFQMSGIYRLVERMA